MPDNIITVLSRGNQELFHSAFIAWLLDPTASHNLGDSFFRALQPHLGCSCNMDFSSGYTVYRESTDSRSRFDILLVPKAQASRCKGLVIENKIKSFGSHLQLDRYMQEGYAVVVLALIRETLDADARHQYPVVEYRIVSEILRSLPLEISNGYHFLIEQYASFLAKTLSVFEILREFGNGALEESNFVSAFANATNDLDLSDNDIRTLNYFYYFAFDEFLHQQAPDLVFGPLDYKEAESQKRNTRWLFEKNMQGPPFMEALIYQPYADGVQWRMHDVFQPLFEADAFQIAPRIELWLDPQNITTLTSQAGILLLGTWSDSLKKYLREKEPYKSGLTRSGPRNFHREPVLVSDLPFSKLADRLRALLAKVCVSPLRGANTT